MNVLLYCYRGNPFCGGQGIYLYNLSRELAKLDVNVDVIVGPPYPDPVESWAGVHKIENLNIWSIKTKDIPMTKLRRVLSPLNFIDYLFTRLHFFPEMQTFSFRAFFKIRKLLKQITYDIIHDFNTLGWGLLPTKLFNIPIVSTIHHPLTRDRDADLMMDKNLWDKLTTLLFYPIAMQRNVINRLDRVITSFRGGVAELYNAFSLKKEKISVVYNGMDINVFKNDGSKRQQNELLFVGNTEDFKKGLIFLLRALLLLPEAVRLTIVDDGPPHKLTAAKMIAELGLEQRVTFTGKLELQQLVQMYSSKTILVMSSLYEGFGLPACEAMACETPVVVTKVGALPEVVTKETGVLVQTQDPQAIANAVMHLLENKKIRQQMGKAGRQRARELFSWESAAANTLDVYKDVIKKYKKYKRK